MASCSVFTYALDVPVLRPLVLSFLTDISRMPEWASNIAKCTQISDGKLEEGSCFEVISSVMGKTLTHEVIIISLNPGFKYTVQSYSGPLPFRIEYNLQDSKKGTFISSKSETDFSGLGPFISKIVEGFAKNQFEKDHQKLKELLESGI